MPLAERVAPCRGGWERVAAWPMSTTNPKMSRDAAIARFVEAFCAGGDAGAVAAIEGVQECRTLSILYSFVCGLNDTALAARCERAIVHRMAELRRPKPSARITHSPAIEGDGAT